MKSIVKFNHSSEYTAADALEMLDMAAAIMEYHEIRDLKVAVSKIQDDIMYDVREYISEQDAMEVTGDPYKDVR